MMALGCCVSYFLFFTVSHYHSSFFFLLACDERRLLKAKAYGMFSCSSFAECDKPIELKKWRNTHENTEHQWCEQQGYSNAFVCFSRCTRIFLVQINLCIFRNVCSFCDAIARAILFILIIIIMEYIYIYNFFCSGFEIIWLIATVIDDRRRTCFPWNMDTNFWHVRERPEPSTMRIFRMYVYMLSVMWSEFISRWHHNFNLFFFLCPFLCFLVFFATRKGPLIKLKCSFFSLGSCLFLVVVVVVCLFINDVYIDVHRWRSRFFMFFILVYCVWMTSLSQLILRK